MNAKRSAVIRVVMKALAAGAHVYVAKPSGATSAQAAELAEAADRAGVKHGVVQDKVFLPGIRALKSLVDGGFFGRILSVRGEFGYWVFEGDWRTPQRPSWNYRKEDGGGIVLDMFPHWTYVLEGLFGPIRAVTARAVTHIPDRWDEHGEHYDATADDAAYAIFELAGGVPAPLDGEPGNAFRLQWEMFVRHVADDAPFPHDLHAGARGVRVAELGLRSSAEGRRMGVPAQ
jgi:predicted dehydrogenase